MDKLLNIIKGADEIVMEVYNRYLESDIEIQIKADNSPLTEADLKSSDYICAKLKELDASIPIICEETKKVPYEERKDWNRFWLVDPIDGTKNFINKDGEFTVNIGLIENGVPILGVISIPCQNVIYYGQTVKLAEEDMIGAFVLNKIGGEIRELKCQPYDESGPINIVCSRSHINKETLEYIEKYTVAEKISAGSSLKFLMLCENRAQLYPRLGPTCEWDIAASHAIINAAGGSITLLDGSNVQYNKENFLNPYFVASTNGY